MAFNEEQFEGRLADALRSLGPEAPASACFVMTEDGCGKVGIRIAEDSEVDHRQFLLVIMAACVEMLGDVDDEGHISSNWIKED